MKLRTELISEIRTLAVTFTAGDELRDWIEEVSDQDIQEALGSRVRTIASAMSRLEIFMKDYGYDDARGDDYEAQAILNEADEAFTTQGLTYEEATAEILAESNSLEAYTDGLDNLEALRALNAFNGPADTSGAKTSAEIAFGELDAQEADREDEDDEDDGVDLKRMAEKLKRARARYEPTVAYTGRLSSNTGDELSIFLAGMAPIDVCYLADLVCIDETGPIALFHWSKYEHLNPGSIRMNAGNKIRSRVKSGLVTLPELRNLLKSEI